ncbi:MULTISPECIES: MurR/RpiR family transcriptional regulator [Mesoplasma]|uniref:MurR/RpiR family transcriptional regulator n=1 Tax=Mesoplasma florum TaxID=2151 RepID=A0A2R3P7P9_MESFO|nr:MULTISPECIES: MurR/RpiR family transcriptional regulator [Mesoplasma]AVN64481.1 MurR/RpiR family transcriptional regulator [Mesoplasma florum]
MFKSIREKLNLIYESNETVSHKLIAKYLIDCLDKGSIPTSKECSQVCFVSESTLTAFSKKYGYEGFREIIIRIKVERELYKPFEKTKLKTKDTNVRKLFLKYMDQIDAQDPQVNKLIEEIKNARKVFIFSSYEQNENVELFASQLQFMDIESYFNSKRRLHDMWIDKSNESDLCLFIVSGLDNQNLVSLYKQACDMNKKTFVVTSSSQSHKFINNKNLIVLQQESNMEIYLSIRNIILNYLFTKIIIKL